MKSNNSSGANDDKNNYSIIKLKRAAVTVLSAASVKAKLLANHEEDQIRQLVSLIIEKQLHKLEVKLAMFADIESVIMRMREQTERARHRLMHERAQIIAARLGLAAPGRGNPGSLPTNKLAMGYGATGPNPNPGAISSQKAPPMRRP
ncbi:SWI/SNF complex subunit SWI3D-like [Asparagus officinalis]|nr:SWI/SNF complex subunit SWI3D-like [Asparagus officinalis]